MPRMKSRKAKSKTFFGDDNATKTIRKQIDDCSKITSVGEPAWDHVKREPGIVAWRVNKQKLEVVPESELGIFYDGDSYLVLHTFKSPTGEIRYDIYIWIGAQSTPDEYGIAAYKMTELDSKILNGAGVQHREIQNNESDSFQAVFKSIKLLKGGYDGIFKNKKVDHKPRLFHISGIKKNVKCTEVSYRYENLNSCDVFIIDDGNNFYQFNGKDSNKEERFKASQVLQELKGQRTGHKIEILDESDVGMNHNAIKAMPRKNVATLRKKTENIVEKYILLRISDQSGSIRVSKVKDTKATLKDFQSDDVYIYDTKDICFVWSGNKISYVEKIMSLPTAEIYLHKSNQNGKSVQIVTEGKESDEFLALLS